MKIIAAALLATAVLAAPAAAAPYILTSGAGDGQVTVGVDGYGAFGSSSGANTSNANYNPVGSQGSGGTTYLSFVALRVG